MNNLRKMLGINEVYNMDCLEGLKLLEDNSVDLVVIDPPYNISIDEWDKFDDGEYLGWIEKVCDELIRVTKRTSSIYIFGDFRFIGDIKVMMNKKDVILKSWIIWDKGSKKQNAIRSFANITEHILFFVREDKTLLKRFGNYLKKKRIEKKLSLKEIGELCDEKWYHRGGHLYFETGLAKPSEEQYKKLKNILELDDTFDCILDNYIFNHESIRLKRNPRDKRKFSYDKQICPNVWYYNNKLEMTKYNHPTVKPIDLIRNIVKASSNEGDLVLDCFMGSGTTAVACKQLNRNFIGFEISRKYCDIINERLSQGVLLSFTQKKQEVTIGEDAKNQ